VDCAAGLDGPKCATVAGVTACKATCPAPLADCADACADLQADRWNCGACGRACQRGESCREGACKPDVYVACFATDDVRPANAALRAGLARKAGDGPIALATSGGRVFAASSLSHSLTSFAPDLTEGHEIVLGGDDFEALGAHGGRLFVSNAGPGTLVVYDPAAARVVDEVALGDLSGVNPRGVDFVGERAYVALYGTNPTSGGQEVVAIDFSALDACTAPPCAQVVRRIPVLAGADADGLPFPSEVAARGSTVYVVLANLKLGGYGFYTDPAGNGKLAVIDTAAEDAVAYVDLGAGCTNPGALALLGDVLWVGCGGTGNLLPVDVSGTSPVPGEPLPAGVFAPGKLAFCGESGYVTDQWSGTVVRFDPRGVEAAASAVVCPTSDAGWAWAADVECAP
jgi:DNA-binding beta-propeller fold protein YncE